MKYSTLTKKELENSYDHPMPELDWGQAYAGESRHYIDWLYGINLSRALMDSIKKTGSFKILSIGRVQGPALKIIVDREKEIETKIQHPYLMPEQPAYSTGVKGQYENAKKIVKKILCLPIHEKLNEEELDYVVENIKSFFFHYNKYERERINYIYY